MAMAEPQRVLAARGLLAALILQGLVALVEGDCGARPFAVDSQEAGSLPAGATCPGYAEDKGCCKAAPIHKVYAFMQYAVKHDEEHLASMVDIIAGAEETLLRLKASGSNACADLGTSALNPRIGAARQLVTQAQDALTAAEHLVMSGLCSYCFPQEEVAEFRLDAQDGPAARQVGAVLVTAEDLQLEQLGTDADAVTLDAIHHCVPGYLASRIHGVPVGGTVPGVGGVGREEPADRNERTKVAVVKGVEAIARLRSWPMGRRHLSEPFAAEAADEFDQDFFEVAERLLAAIIGPAARLVHQLQLLTLAFSGTYHWSAGHPVAKLFWGHDPEPDPTAASAFVPSVLPPPVMGNGSADDPGAAFGLVVLISNQTTEEAVDEILERLDGRRVIILEDTCGHALESLGYGCHGGGKAQALCLRPAHASRISQLPDAAKRPIVAWRRHGSTRSVAHSAWELASSYWGKESTAWIADLRPAHRCPGALPLPEAIGLVPGARLRLMRRPEELFALSSAEAAPEGEPDLEVATDAPPPGAVPQSAWLPSTPLATRLAEYIEFHRRGVASLVEGSDKEVPVLVYSCQPFAQCGGHGDRLNGIVTAFLLAVLTRRVFLIDSEGPLPLHMLYTPRMIDWRVSGNVLATAGLRHLSYHDKRRQFEADIGRLASWPDPLLVVSMNYRMIRMLFEAPALRDQARELGLTGMAPPFLVAEVFDLLFARSAALRHEVSSLRASLGGLQDRKFISVHLRTGDITWDPQRHGKGELQHFLDCAQQVELELGLPPDTPWLLATDSAEVAAIAADNVEELNGKLRVPGGAGRVHIDRSDMAAVLQGSTANYAEWWLFGRAAAAVISRSYFGETAAEVGRVPATYFAPGNGCVRTDLTSS